MRFAKVYSTRPNSQLFTSFPHVKTWGVSDAIDNFGSCVEFRIQLRYNKSSNDKKGKINKFVLKMRGMGTRTVVDFAFSMFFVI